MIFPYVINEREGKREALIRFLGWVARESWREEGVQVQLDGRNPERASRMGILLIAGQLRTNRQIFFFTPTRLDYMWMNVVVGNWNNPGTCQPRPDRSSIYPLDSWSLPMLCMNNNFLSV